MVLGVLIETVDGVGDETAQGNQEGGWQGFVHIRSETAEMDVVAEGKTHIEASAHETSQQGDGKTLREVEVLHCRLLLFFWERSRLHATCHTDDGNTEKSDYHTENYAEGEWWEGVHLWEEDVEQYWTHDGAETCTGSQGDALTQSYSQIAHGKTESQSAYAPEHTKEHGHRYIEAITVE